MLILSSVSLAIVASGCCPGIPGKKIDWEMIGLGGLGGCIYGVLTDICIVIFTRGKIKSIVPLILPPIVGSITGMILPKKIAPLCLVPGIPLLGYSFALLLKSRRE